METMAVEGGSRDMGKRGAILRDGWHNVRLLSAQYNSYNRDYHGESSEGEQLPMLNVLSRDEDGIHQQWGAELMSRAETSVISTRCGRSGAPSI